MNVILVCGGAGFIGSHFVRMALLRSRNIRVINVDKLTYAGNLDNLCDVRGSKNHHFIRADIADERAMKRIFSRYSPHYVINFAAETHVDRSIHGHASDFVRSNILGVFTLLERVRTSPSVKKFVDVSTDEVYGDLPIGSKELFTEDLMLRPSSPYAASKAAGDLLCLSYVRTYGSPVVITRCSNNFGPNQYPATLIPFFISRILDGKKVPLYGDGKNVRDWIYVSDHCDALWQCLMKGIPGRVYNISARQERSNIGIAKALLHAFKRDDSWIEYVADRPGHDRRYALSNTRITRELKWRPKYAFSAAFSETVKWYKNNKKWLKRVKMKGSINPHIKK